MKKFTLSGTMVFEAESIDEAFHKISEHFLALYLGQESDVELFPGTTLRLASTQEPFLTDESYEQFVKEPA